MREFAASGENDLGPRAALVLLILVVVAAALLRIPSIAAESFWYDEAVSWFQSRGSFSDLLRLTAADNYPPLHNVVLFLVIHTIGDADWMLRLPSALFALLSIIAVYWLGSMLHSRKAGLLAALLLALSPFHIWYSQEARAYALLALTSTLFCATAFWYTIHPTLQKAIAAVLAGAALLYSHPFGTFSWVSVTAIACAFLFFGTTHPWRRSLAFLVTQIAAALLFVPWAIVLLGRAKTITSGGFWIETPTVETVLRQLSGLMNDQVALYLVGTTLAVAVLALPRVAIPHPEAPAGAIPSWRKLVTLLAWALGPWIAGIVVSVAVQPLLTERYLIGTLPAFAVLAGIGIGALTTTRLLFFATGVAMAAAFTITILIGSDAPRDDWRGVAQYLRDNLGPDDCLAYPSWEVVPFTYYYRDQGSCVVPVSSVADLANIPLDATRALLVLRHMPQYLAAMQAPGSRWTNLVEAQFINITVASFDATGPAGAAAVVTLVLSGDAYKGAPEFAVGFDGSSIGTGVVDAAFVTEDEGGYAEGRDLAAHSQSFDFPIPWTIMNPDGEIRIDFTNDAWGGEGSALDRNLYVVEVRVDGVAVPLERMRIKHENGSDSAVPSLPLAILGSSDAAVAMPPSGGWPIAGLTTR